MITITTEGVEDLLQGLSGMRRQIPYAVANGVNVTARRVKEATAHGMASAFDRPTPFVMNSLQMSPALAPRTTTASVWFKDPPKLGVKKHFLTPQVEGGTRPLKGFEKGISHNKFVMPSKSTKLDQYGNLGRGQITRLLSIAGGFHEVGFSMNAKTKSKNQRNFVRLMTQRGNLPPGIYERVMGDEAGGRAGRFLLARALTKQAKIKGGLGALSKRTKELMPRGLKLVVLFTTKTPTYTKRLDFYGIANKVCDAYLRQDMSRAIGNEIERELAYRASHGPR